MNLGIGDIGVSSKPGEVLRTYALGSCVAALVWDPARRIAGMVHIALPDSSTSPAKSAELPGYFADTGLKALMDVLKGMGCQAARGGIRVKLAGGANVADPGNTFNIGKRNVLAAKKILWSMGLGAVAEDVGGSISRTVSLDVSSGTVQITSPGLKAWEI